MTHIGDEQPEHSSKMKGQRALPMYWLVWGKGTGEDLGLSLSLEGQGGHQRLAHVLLTYGSISQDLFSDHVCFANQCEKQAG